MRIIVAFDFKEGDAVGVEAVISDLLEELSEKTLVLNVYGEEKYWLPEKALLRDLDRNFLVGALLDRLVNIIGDDSKEHLMDMLDIEIFAGRIGELGFTERYGE